MRINVNLVCLYFGNFSKIGHFMQLNIVREDMCIRVYGTLVIEFHNVRTNKCRVVKPKSFRLSYRISFYISYHISYRVSYHRSYHISNNLYIVKELITYIIHNIQSKIIFIFMTIYGQRSYSYS